MCIILTDFSFTEYGTEWKTEVLIALLGEKMKHFKCANSEVRPVTERIILVKH